jgi:hypothetical protein
MLGVDAAGTKEEHLAHSMAVRCLCYIERNLEVLRQEISGQRIIRQDAAYLGRSHEDGVRPGFGYPLIDLILTRQVHLITARR